MSKIYPKNISKNNSLKLFLKIIIKNYFPKLFINLCLKDINLQNTYMLKVFRKFLQNYCSKLFPKIITQNYNSLNLFPKIISQNYSAKQFPKPTSQNYCRKLLSEIVCKIAPESCSPKLLFFKIIILQYYSRKLAKTTPQSQNYSPKCLCKAVAPKRQCFKFSPRSDSPKIFSKVIPKSCSAKLMPKAAPQS